MNRPFLPQSRTDSLAESVADSLAESPDHSLARSLPLAAPPAPPATAEDQPHGWTWQMKHAIRDQRQLLAAVGLAGHAQPATGLGRHVPASGVASGLASDLAAALPAETEFPCFVPPALLQRIVPGNPADPILRQVLPVAEETADAATPGYSRDPLAEFAAGVAAVERLEQGATLESPTASEALAPRQWIQKYSGRALLITTGACGVHCRYCFRRHFPYPAAPQQRTRWQPWLEPIAADPTIQEVILSGGDPLVLSDVSLERLLNGLRAIPHVRWLRIHSRMPVVIPQRVTRDFVELFPDFAAKVMVIHANHAQELDDEVAAAIARLRAAGFQVLNQAVLLRGVNDSVEALEGLCRRLVDCGVVPYYLHQLDRVQGAAHFEVTQAEGLQLLEALRRRLPGHAVPRYVQEIPGQPYKTVLA